MLKKNEMRASIERYQQLTHDKDRYGGTKVGSNEDQKWYDSFDIDTMLEEVEKVS